MCFTAYGHDVSNCDTKIRNNALRGSTGTSALKKGILIYHSGKLCSKNCIVEETPDVEHLI